VIDEIKVAIEPPVIANSQVYIDSVTFNGFSLALSNVSYYPLTGSVESSPLPVLRPLFKKPQPLH
jgi:hypothetical protein